MMDADMDMGGNEPTKIARPCLIRTSPYRSKYKIDMDGHKLSFKIDPTRPYNKTDTNTNTIHSTQHQFGIN